MSSGAKPFVVGEADRARSELKQAIELGGEKIIFSQEELAKLKRFRKGTVAHPIYLFPKPAWTRVIVCFTRYSSN